VGLLQTLSLLGVAQSVLMSTFLLTGRRAAGLSNRLLAALLLAFAVLTGGFVVMSAETLFFRYFVAATLANQVGFLVGPLLYLHIRALLDRQRRLAGRELRHLLPFLGAVVFLGTRYTLLGDGLPELSGLVLVLSAGVLIHNLAYFEATRRLLRSRSVELCSARRGAGHGASGWLRFVLLGYIVIWATRVQFFLVGNLMQNPRWCPYTVSLFLLTAFLFFNTVVYLALLSPEIFGRGARYLSSNLDEAAAAVFRVRLEKVMERDKPFTDPSLSLDRLAASLAVPPRHLSQVIHEAFERNFSDFINRYRVEESKRILRVEAGKSVLEIAHQVGFSSKSAFNAAFKRHCGVAPREFRRAAAPRRA
jgi:AraC-like DNA-binding protein